MNCGSLCSTNVLGKMATKAAISCEMAGNMKTNQE